MNDERQRAGGTRLDADGAIDAAVRRMTAVDDADAMSASEARVLARLRTPSIEVHNAERTGAFTPRLAWAMALCVVALTLAGLAWRLASPSRPTSTPVVPSVTVARSSPSAPTTPSAPTPPTAASVASAPAPERPPARPRATTRSEDDAPVMAGADPIAVPSIAPEPLQAPPRLAAAPLAPPDAIAAAPIAIVPFDATFNEEPQIP